MAGNLLRTSPPSLFTQGDLEVSLEVTQGDLEVSLEVTQGDLEVSLEVTHGDLEVSLEVTCPPPSSRWSSRRWRLIVSRHGRSPAAALMGSTFK